MRAGAASIAVASAVTASAQGLVQGPKIVGTGHGSFVEAGRSVAVSADGTTVVVGGPYDATDIGATWIFTRSGGVFGQQGAKLVGTGSQGMPLQGFSVAASADGNTVLVGGPSDMASGLLRGAAWVFTRSGGVWTQQGAKLVGTGGDQSSEAGVSVALSADGDTALVGGPTDGGTGSAPGAVWVFTRSAGTWTQQGLKLGGQDRVGNAGQGTSVALSDDGNTAIFGGPGDDGDVGAAWVFTRTGGIWSQQGPKLVGSGAVGVAGHGYSVALSGDGNIALVGGPYDNGNTGAAWVFTRSGGVWSQQGSKLVGTGSAGTAYQGWSGALSSDGNLALVGGPFDDAQKGAVWVFTRAGGIWSQAGQKLLGPGRVGPARQGAAVALSSNGNVAAVGGPYDDSDIGAAWIFERTCARGDVNGDGALDVADVFYLINFLFAGGPAPRCF